MKRIIIALALLVIMITAASAQDRMAMVDYLTERGEYIESYDLLSFLYEHWVDIDLIIKSTNREFIDEQKITESAKQIVEEGEKINALIPDKYREYSSETFFYSREIYHMEIQITAAQNWLEENE